MNKVRKTRSLKGYTVLVPALPGCITYGDNLNHAMEMAKEANEGYIDLLKEQR